MIKKYQNQEFLYTPMLVSNRGRIDDIDSEEEALVWKKFETLSEEKKDVLAGAQLKENNKNFQSINKLTLEEVGLLSLLERRVFFAEVKSEELLQEGVRIFGVERASLVEQYIKKEVLTLKSPSRKISYIEDEVQIEKTEPTKKESQKLPLLQALSKYPNLGNQMISAERIRIKSQPDLVRSSLFNWIKYYRDELGIGQHSTVERGQFLFDSENGKKLSSSERERLNLILKSIEENFPLTIDTENQAIIFPEVLVAKKREQNEISVTPVLAPAPSISIPPEVTNAAPVQEKAGNESAIIFTPRSFAEKETKESKVAQKFQPSQSPYEKIIIPNQILGGDRPLPGATDVTSAAEELKREPKPGWIKGSFTKESIPDKVQAEPIKGAMSFSLNHVLPVEQEADVSKEISKKEEVLSQKMNPVVVPPIKNIPPRRSMSQFHIRPVSGDNEN